MPEYFAYCITAGPGSLVRQGVNTYGGILDEYDGIRFADYADNEPTNFTLTLASIDLFDNDELKMQVP